MNARFLTFALTFNGGANQLMVKRSNSGDLIKSHLACLLEVT